MYVDARPIGPTCLRLSPDHTPSFPLARVSDYCCRPRIDSLLYIIIAKGVAIRVIKLAFNSLGSELLVRPATDSY